MGVLAAILLILFILIYFVYSIIKGICIYFAQKKAREQEWLQQKQTARAKKERETQAARVEEERQAQLKAINEQIISMITEDFAKNNWTRWDSSIHRDPGQLDRLKRATDSSNPIHLVQYNPLFKIAKIRGTRGDYYLTSGERCSCPDYRKRKKPCKHMYFLATISDEYDEKLEKDYSLFALYSYDNVLGGLKFTIAGRNQAPVKDFIVKHSGTYIDFKPNETDALVVADDKVTGKVTDAIMNDVQIMTFDDLQSLFNTYHSDETEKSPS